MTATHCTYSFIIERAVASIFSSTISILEKRGMCCLEMGSIYSTADHMSTSVVVRTKQGWTAEQLSTTINAKVKRGVLLRRHSTRLVRGEHNLYPSRNNHFIPGDVGRLGLPLGVYYPPMIVPSTVSGPMGRISAKSYGADLPNKLGNLHSSGGSFGGRCTLSGERCRIPKICSSDSCPFFS
jgi:hypothetical protein